ncbi:recombination regulator RecX [Bacillus sp. Marseille-P3800]|uniref:recombination regulator RecX n=1 Tax=Bacillus sp. Marseille-P3800 TaxID=2014782 RepID=UPI00159BA3E3|nr:recombination regulator RecX [Bacillus sp. Marseille-P3800]
MTTISKITVQKKAKQRYNIFVLENEVERYSFSVDEAVLIKYGLRKGIELDEAFMKTIVDADEAKKTFHLAVHYLSYRMRSEKEIVDYLRSKEREEDHIKQAVLRLKEERLIDDLAFAHAFVRSKANQGFIGPTKLKQQLYVKGVSEQHSDEAISEYDVTWEVEQLLLWKEKQDRKSGQTKFSKQQQINKWKTQLISKGFTLEAITQFLKSLDDEKDIEEERAALDYQGEKLFRTYERKYSDSFELKQKMIQALYRKGFSFEDAKAFVDDKLKGMSE